MAATARARGLLGRFRCRAALLGAALLLSQAGCSQVPLALPLPLRQPVETVYVIDRGWHTEIGLAVPDLDGRLAAVARRFPGARYLAVGFGDRAYLLSRHRGLGTMVEALFPGPGMLLVTALRVQPSIAFGASRVVPLDLSRDGLHAILRFLSASFAAVPDEASQELGTGPYPGSLYYASAKTYDLAYTCNTWAAQALREGGLPVVAAGTIFAEQLMLQVRRIAARQGTVTRAPETTARSQ